MKRANVGGRMPGGAARFTLAGRVAGGLLFLSGCAGTAPPREEPTPASLPATVLPSVRELDEKPVPDGDWRGHRLARCRADLEIPPDVESLLALSSQFYRERSGSDGMIELELAVKAGQRHPLVLLALGQLYLLAGQGEPSLLPKEGPARDVGSWRRNQPRLLRRAQDLLEESAATWPDDGGIDYLLADVHRAAGDTARAAELVSGAAGKCTGGRSFGLMQFYQQLNRYPARHEGGPSPVYPPGAVARGEQGQVVVDLLLSPAAAVRQALVVSSPSSELSEAAAACLRQGRFIPARIGKYPVWSWLRVTVAFRLG